MLFNTGRATVIASMTGLFDSSSVIMLFVKVTPNNVFPKYLGITFDGKLSWKCYVDAVVRKVYSRLHCLRNLRFLN